MIKSASILVASLSALVITVAMVAFAASPAVAQTAGNLKCNGCVNSKDIKNGRIKNKDIKGGQLKLGKLAPALSGEITKNRTFYATADANGEEVTLATNGPLRMFMRCTINDAGTDRIELFTTSSQAPWYQENSTARTAGEVLEVDEESAPTNTPALDDFFPGSTLAPDGSAFTTVASVSLGLNLFGHRCIAVGTVNAIKGNL